MCSEQHRQRFQELRAREGTLTEPEKAELAQLVQELKNAEAAYLTPATERLRRERERIETQNRTLELLARGREALVQRLGTFLEEARAERQAIDCELAAVLAGSQGSSTDE